MANHLILDTHHHIWQVSRGDYAWMTPDLPIARDFMPADFAPELHRNGVTQTIVVQAADTEAETDFLLQIAQDTDWIVGVCGWLDLDSDAFPDRLSHYMQNPLWKSFRPMLQDLDEPDWILKPRVLKNLGHAADMGARFELLTKLPQLPHAVTAFREVPGLKAVVNHLSKPDIASGEVMPWATQIAQLAEMPDVVCKLSGMITEAGADWSPGALRPYVHHVIDVFGPQRVMFGSDWPVMLLAASAYGEAINALRTTVAERFGPADLHALFYQNGARFYGLDGAPG